MLAGRSFSIVEGAPRYVALSLGLLAAGAASRARADGADPVVVQVGGLNVPGSEVARRLAAIPEYQARALGGPAKVRRAFVDQVIVPELLFANEARRRGLEKVPAVVQRVDYEKSRALVESLRRDAAASVTDEDARAYYAAHSVEYRKPETIRIWRILVADENVARKLLGEFRSVDGPAKWQEAAREQSIDPATKMRGGDLGFVAPDGHTNVPQLEVDPVLYVAASKVRDGQLAPDPVKEGDHFAVVWRRGTLSKVDLPFEAVRDAIRGSLVDARLQETTETLLADLRKQYVTAEDVSPLENMQTAPVRPGPLRATSSASLADPLPRATDRGLR